MLDRGSTSGPWDALPFFRRAPLVPAAALLCLGVAAGIRLPLPAVPLLLLALGAALAAWRRPGRARLALAALAVLALGAGRAALDARAAERLARILDRPREQLEIEFRVTGEPAAISLSRIGGEDWVVPGRLERIHRTTSPQDVGAEIAVRVSGPLPPGRFDYGNRVRAHGVMERREGPGAMLWPADYRFTVFDPTDAAVTATGQGSRFVAACLRLRARAAELLPNRAEQEEVRGAVLRALTLGMRGEINQELNDLFARTGTLHILAVSGLHVVIIGGLLLFFVRWTPLPRHRWGLVLIPALTIFVCATGLKASSVRALLMASAFGIAPLLWRKPDARTSLALSAVILLLLSPRQLLDLGFQFSFLSMLALIGLGPAVDALLRRGFEPDPFAEPLQTASTRLPLRLARAFCGFVAMNLVAWAASAPLTAGTFHVWSPVAVLSNLVVVPLSTLVCWLGFLALVAGAIWAPLGALVHTLGLWTVKLMLAWADLTHDLPGAWQYVMAPPAWFLAAFYLVFTWLVLRQRLDLRALAATGALLLALAGVAVQRGGVRDLWVMNQDGVAAIAARTAGSRGLVADPGGRFTTTRLLRSLREKGLDHIDVLCSRLDTRRAAALPELVTAFRVTRVLLPAGPPPESPLLDTLRTEAIPVETVARGDRRFTGDIFQEFLSPAEGAEQGLAARISRDGLGLVWLGGVSAAGEAALNGPELDAAGPVLVVNASAGIHSLPAELLSRMQPACIVVCRPDFPDARRSQQPVIDRWLREGWRVLELENGGELRLDLTSPSLNEFLPLSPVRKD